MASTTMKDYQLGVCIGKGAYGAVYRAVRASDGEVVAIKQISLEGVAGIELDAVMSEIRLLERLSHPNIVRYIASYQSDSMLHIVLEYAVENGGQFCEDGALTKLFRKGATVPEVIARDYVRQVMEGLAYLHSQNVIHCDIKCANILKSKNGVIKLTDFGVSRSLKTEEEFNQDVVGTPYWMAPEIIQLQGATSAADVWSLGCTIIELLTGKPPYHDLRSMSALYHIVEDDRPPLVDGISPELNDLLTRIFVKDPAKRPPISELLKHDFIVKARPASEAVAKQTAPFLVTSALQSDDKLRQAFGILDPRKTGSISAESLRLLLRGLGCVWSDRNMADAFKKANVQATASFEQFRALLQHAPRLSAEPLRFAFRAFDPNQSGLIKLSDLKRILQTVGDKLSAAEFDAFRSGVYVDEEGRLSYEAWMKTILVSS